MIRILLTLLCLTLATSAAQEKSPSAERKSPPAHEKSPPAQYNFLFIVDTSASMLQRKDLSVRMIHDLVAGGFRGQIRPGDSIDIWTYDEENHIAAFPPHIWDDAEAKRIADEAGQFVARQNFKGASHFAPVATDLNLLLPNTRRLLAVILTAAEEPFSGIRPDVEINERVGKMKRIGVNPRYPFFISLAAVNGEISQWAVYDGDGRNDLASLPSRPKSPAMAAAETKQQNAVKAAQKKPEPARRPEPSEPAAQPMVFALPPGARVVSPVPVPPIQAPQPAQNTVSRPNAAVAEAVTVSSNVLTAVRNETAATNSGAAGRANLVPQAPTGVANPPNNSPAPKPIALSSVSSPAVPAAAQKPAGSAEPARNQATSANSIPEPVKDKAPAASSEPVQAPTAAATVSSASRPLAEKAAEPLHEPAPLPQGAISAGVVYLGLAVAGVALLAFGAILFLRRAKARQGGSIISRSMLQ